MRRTSLPPVLVVDDERNMRLSIHDILEEEDYRIVLAESAEQALKIIAEAKGEFLMVVTDARMGGMSGYELLKRIVADWPKLPVLLITAFATPKLAVEAIRSGAVDYLSKPFAPEELLHAVHRCVERHSLLRENAALRAKSSQVYEAEQIVGESPEMHKLRQLIRTVGPTDATVLILGESGTGKELVAGALHHHSHRRSKNYVRLNCAAIPESLLESELFGHEKGAFTGALREKLGRVEEADGGTIFLDEIGDMSRSLQAKLLRFLEDGSFSRVGGNEELRVNVRIIAATNRDLVKAIKANEFREDLYHRLNVMQFRPAPLRERGRDVLLLARHFLKSQSYVLNRHEMELTPAADKKLLSHNWPGNVRELRNVMERAIILEPTNKIQPNSLPAFHLEAVLTHNQSAIDLGDMPFEAAVHEFEKRLILTALRRCDMSFTKAAEELKISRHALRYRMQRLQLDGHAEEAEPGT
ncbi:MAG: sigma-54-dependent Fis family transcriptional regulator [Pedosphaera sp.]|nr:sigma-54-dependent Fis family transcriptional regulator [Pedosphaera sp.]